MRGWVVAAILISAFSGCFEERHRADCDAGVGVESPGTQSAQPAGIFALEPDEAAQRIAAVYLDPIRSAEPTSGEEVRWQSWRTESHSTVSVASAEAGIVEAGYTGVGTAGLETPADIVDRWEGLTDGARFVYEVDDDAGDAWTGFYVRQLTPIGLLDIGNGQLPYQGGHANVQMRTVHTLGDFEWRSQEEAIDAGLDHITCHQHEHKANKPPLAKPASVKVVVYEGSLAYAVEGEWPGWPGGSSEIAIVDAVDLSLLQWQEGAWCC